MAPLILAHRVLTLSLLASMAAGANTTSGLPATAGHGTWAAPPVSPRQMVCGMLSSDTSESLAPHLLPGRRPLKWSSQTPSATTTPSVAFCVLPTPPSSHRECTLPRSAKSHSTKGAFVLGSGRATCAVTTTVDPPASSRSPCQVATLQSKSSLAHPPRPTKVADWFARTNAT